MFRYILSILAALALLSGPAGAVPYPPAPVTVPVEWERGADGTVSIRFAVDEGVDPDLMDRLNAALLRPRLPVMLWTIDPRTGLDHLAFDVDPASPATK